MGRGRGGKWFSPKTQWEKSWGMGSHCCHGLWRGCWHHSDPLNRLSGLDSQGGSLEVLTRPACPSEQHSNSFTVHDSITEEESIRPNMI